MSNGNYLLLFTITPVQDFIVQSRKLVDLYGSSEILSEMSRIGMICCKKKGGELILPQLHGKNASYPNRFLVEFENKSIDEVKKIAMEIEKELKNYLKSFYNFFYEESMKKELPEKVKKVAVNHIESYFSFYWVIEEVSSYREAFDNIERKLAAVKNTRIFSQLNEGNGEIGRKCSICGERNVVFVRGRDIRKLWLEDLNQAIKLNNFILKDKEGLCGVCFAKRMKNFKLLSRCKDENSKSFKFPSLAAILYGDRKEVEVIEKKLCDFTNKILNSFKNEEFKNEEFVETPKLDIEVLINNDFVVFKEAVLEFFEENKGVEKIIKKLYDKFRKEFKNDFKKVSPYYAVIMLDGDKMGEKLKGERVEDLKDYHQKLSKNLSEMAESLKNIEKAVNVYAGGDDYLGFVNLRNLFSVLLEIKDKWDKQFNDLSNNDKFTFSAGVVIAHYKTPLRKVLEEVRSAEKYAKNEGRNKIAFYVLKRSGEKRKGIIEVDDLETYKKLLEKLLALKEDLSLDFIVDFEKEFWFIDEDIELERKIYIKEIERLINKKYRKENKESLNEIKDIFEKLVKNIKKLQDFNGLLSVIRFIDRELRYVKSNGN